MRVNIYKKVMELQRIQGLIKDARKLVEKELGRKVLDAFLSGKNEKEIYELVRHIVCDVYGYDRLIKLKKNRSYKVNKLEDKEKELEELNREIEEELNLTE